MKWRWTAYILTGVGSLLVIGAAALAGMIYFRQKPASAEPLVQPSAVLAVDSPAPDFELSSLDGQIYHLADLSGKPVVVNFWATWCPPCKEEMPQLQDYYDRYSDQFSLLAVDFAESETLVRPFVDELGLTFPILMDPDTAVNDLYRIQGYPTTYFINASGKISNIHVGYLSANKLKKYMQNLGIPQ
jgi:thiol-disulfide isomerase/thioredoxin